MASESLRNIRTLRQVKTSLDTAGSKKTKTTNSLSRTKEEIEQLESIDNRRTGQILAKERARCAAYDASVEKSRQRLLKSRVKLANIINQNRALTKLRHELQQARWQKTNTAAQEAQAEKKEPQRYSRLHGIELKF